ncbi:TPA: hypothetical protein EYP75_03670 [Candidatus Bathyarchaeota archaeon]|nr:hypothetical protein [Candidatus Bathyarchaeota archaeon]
MPRESRNKNPSRSRSIRKAYVKIATYRPPRSLIAAIVIGVSIFLLGGGIYDLFMNPLAVLPVGAGRFLAFIPYRINEQLLVGSIGVMILYALGALGLILIYYSTRYMHNQRYAFILMGIGASLLLISFIMVESILFWIMNY